ncbi:MAG TPA: trypsin-like peptidase domain-containing protein, partial [Ktedonobacterales bacterium]|nr:trypsin-like peptidase domain-containing protein [Ktedonobacterales bacterium]
PAPTRPTRQIPDASPRRRAPLVALASILLLVVALFAAGCSVDTSGQTSSGNDGSQLGGSQTVAVPPAATDLQQTIINVIAAVQPSVVEVQASGGASGGSIGSGEVITADGYIVTNDHVVAGFSSFTVALANGKQLPARLIGQSPQDDLAVLKVDGQTLHPITLGDSSKVLVGQFAIAIGSPLGLTQSATFGIISALNRSAQEGSGGPASILTGLIQTSAPINPGNSGGALVDLQGRLIGVPTLGVVNPESGAAAEGIGFAIPSNRVKFVADQLIKNGHLVNSGQGFLGVQGVDVTPSLAQANGLPVQQGVLIAGFANDATGKSPAQAAGLQTGDIITAVNGQQVTGNGDLGSALISQQPGAKVTITYVRGSSQTHTVSVTLGERPTNLGG